MPRVGVEPTISVPEQEEAVCVGNSEVTELDPSFNYSTVVNIFTITTIRTFWFAN
jgi:hypothetical protein